VSSILVSRQCQALVPVQLFACQSRGGAHICMWLGISDPSSCRRRRELIEDIRQHILVRESSCSEWLLGLVLSITVSGVSTRGCDRDNDQGRMYLRQRDLLRFDPSSGCCCCGGQRKMTMISNGETAGVSSGAGTLPIIYSTTPSTLFNHVAQPLSLITRSISRRRTISKAASSGGRRRRSLSRTALTITRNSNQHPRVVSNNNIDSRQYQRRR